MRAPCADAPRASAHTVFQASIDPSGTVNARLMPGFSRGSQLQRLADRDLLGRQLAASRQPSMNWSP